MAIPIAEKVYGEILTNAAPHELASTIPDILSLLARIVMTRSASLSLSSVEKEIIRACDFEKILRNCESRALDAHG